MRKVGLLKTKYNTIVYTKNYTLKLPIFVKTNYIILRQYGYKDKSDTKKAPNLAYD